MKALISIGLTFIGVLVQLSAGAFAASYSTSMPVTVTVMQSCSITAGLLAFGTYDPVVGHATSPLDGTSTITVACSKGTTATIALGLGANVSGTTRRMSDGAGNFMVYEIYTDPSRSLVWNPTSTVSYTAPSKAPFTFTAYGRVPGGQDLPMGNYSDTIVATINY